MMLGDANASLRLPLATASRCYIWWSVFSSLLRTFILTLPQFGSGVLLDPAFNFGSVQSKTFGPTISNLLSLIHTLPVEADQTPSSVLGHNESLTRACLFATVDHIGTPELRAYLDAFLADHPPLFSDPGAHHEES